MKKLILVLLMMFITSAIYAQKSIAVSTFDIMGGAVTKDEAEAITELFISELVSTGKVNVVDRANFDKLIEEMKFQNSDFSNSEKTVALGNAVNANLVIRGKIMKVGSSMYLSSTVIDLNTANVLSSAREQFNSIDDIFGLLTKYANQIIEGLSLKIGDIGPGGGIVFYIEGKKAYEVSEILGNVTWETANQICKDFRGGEYDDWYFPTIDEIKLVRSNLGNIGIINKKGWYWSSSHGKRGPYFCDFYDGWTSDNISHFSFETCFVRAIRAFNN